MRIGLTIAPVAALLLSVTLLPTGNGLQGTLLPVRAEFEGFGTFNIGVLGSSYFVGFALGCIFAAQVVRTVGHIRAFAALTAMSAWGEGDVHAAFPHEIVDAEIEPPDEERLRE